MRSNNYVIGSLLYVLGSCFACTTAQQSATGSTSSSPSPVTTVATSAHAPQPGANPGANGGSTAEVRAPGNIGVADITNQAVGAKVTVSGVFMGFNGACLAEAPSRSAWHLAASKEPNAACVYVDGPFPAGLSPAVHAGTNTTVTATIAELGTARYLVSTGQ